MRKILLIPDSFKGTLTAGQVCRVMARAVAAVYPRAQTVALPIADGGEGTVAALVAAAGGQTVARTVSGPFGAPLTAEYGLLDGGRTAVIEMAACAGLPLAAPRPDPESATTVGVGQLMLDAAVQGARRIIVGLGGSATNDGGCGAASACGVRFIGGDGQDFIPVGGTLPGIARIDASGLHPALRAAAISAMCDIDNPLTGPTGAAHVFAPQKGADPAAVRRLDQGLAHLARIIARDLGLEVDRMPGAGAAGGMGAGMAAFFGAPLQSGIDAVLDAVDFESALNGADLVLTGEGRIDGQSLRGKAVAGIVRRARSSGVPVVAVVGDIGDDMAPLYAQGLAAVFSTSRQAADFERVRGRAAEDLYRAVENLMRFCRAVRPEETP